jgi:hypothetical protein
MNAQACFAEWLELSITGRVWDKADAGRVVELRDAYERCLDRREAPATHRGQDVLCLSYTRTMKLATDGWMAAR